MLIPWSNNTSLHNGQYSRQFIKKWLGGSRNDQPPSISFTKIEKFLLFRVVSYHTIPYLYQNVKKVWISYRKWKIIQTLQQWLSYWVKSGVTGSPKRENKSQFCVPVCCQQLKTLAFLKKIIFIIHQYKTTFMTF